MHFLFSTFMENNKFFSFLFGWYSKDASTDTLRCGFIGYHLSYTKSKKDLYMLTVKLLGSSCLTITTWHLHHEFNFTSRILETVENSLPLSYLPPIKWLLIALHYHGQSYRGHSIVDISQA